MNTKEKVSLLRDEYLMLQEFYEDVDRRCLTIKYWSATVTVAIIGAGFAYANQEYSKFIFLGSFSAAVVFWMLEALWRGTHFYLANRIKKLEGAFRSEEWASLSPFQLYSDWAKEFKKYGSQTRNYMFKQVTRTPHFTMAVIGIALFLASLFGWINFK